MPAPPLPEKPQPTPPTTSCLPLALAIAVGSGVVMLLCILTLGWFAPVVVLVGLAAGFIGLQYLVWGRWLEKIARDQAKREGEDPPPYDP